MRALGALLASASSEVPPGLPVKVVHGDDFGDFDLLAEFQRDRDEVIRRFDDTEYFPPLIGTEQ